MKRKVLATALCAAIMAIAMGFAVVAKTADASLKAEGNFKILGEIPTPSSGKPNGNEIENEQGEAAADEVTDEVTDDEVGGMDPANTEEAPGIEPVERPTPSEATSVSNENELRSALQKSGKKVVLDDDIQVTDKLVVGEGVDVAIDGGGHKIYSGENPDLRYMLVVGSGAEVSLQNITIDTTGMDYPGKNEDGSYIDYYAINTQEGSSLTINDGTNLICNDTENTLENKAKCGIWLAGTGVMNGGEISGFFPGGITVTESAEFTFNDGTIRQISVKTKRGYHGGAINNIGHTTINGGTLTESLNGVLNSGNLLMTGGEVTDNWIGIDNMNEDAKSGELYYPVAELNGGYIAGNGKYALYNEKRGKIIIDGAHISGEVVSAMKLFGKSQKSDPKAVVMNSDNSILNLISGEIVSNAANEIAVYNDGTSKITMKDGTISANGAGSVAIQNDNTSAGAVEVLGGTVSGEVVNTPAPSGSGSSGGSGGSGRIITRNSATMPSIPETPGAWVEDQTGWKFTAPNQTPYVNTWIRSKNQWYWVGADSYMRTGWNQIAEKWYYLMPVTGEMKTGWLQDGDSWYYLDETGARKTGWVQDGTKWYYLNQDGKMAVNTTTPDGYKIDRSGAWVK